MAKLRLIGKIGKVSLLPCVILLLLGGFSCVKNLYIPDYIVIISRSVFTTARENCVTWDNKLGLQIV